MKNKKKDSLLKKYYSLHKKEKWKEAKSILEVLVKDDSESFWLWTCLSSATYELKDYKTALKYSKKAYKLNSNSPLVLWDYAGVLYMLEKHKKAIKMWEKILHYGEKKIAYELTSEGKKWAKRLMNDSRFKLGQSYYLLDKDFKSKGYFKEYIAYREKGVSSLFKKKEALKYIQESEEILVQNN